MLHTLINWYTKRLPFPFRGWKYARRLLSATGQLKSRFVKKIHNGLFIEVSPGEHIQQQLFWYGFYEKPQILFWERLIQPGMTVLDIGSNIGYYSLIASLKTGTGKVFAFEPQSAPLKALRSNLTLNRLTNVIPVPFGASDQAGPATLYLAGAENEGMGSLRTGLGFGSGSEKIELVRLDDWCLSNKVNPDLVKMDIEGAEYGALLGMERLLREDRPILLIEISAELLGRFQKTPADVYQFLQKMEYHAFGIDEKSRPFELNGTPEGELIVFSPSEKGSVFKTQFLS